MIFASQLLADSQTATWLDPLIIGVMAISVVFGFARGLIRSIAGLLGLALGALFAGRIAALIDPSLDQAHIQHPPVTGAVAFVVAFVAIVVAVEMALRMLRFVQTILFLGWIDRIGGALFGLLRGVLISMVILAGLAMFGSSSFNKTMRQAAVAVFLWQNMSSLAAMLPEGMKQSMQQLVHDKAPFTDMPVPVPQQ